MVKEKETDKDSSVNLHCIDAIEISLFIEKQGLGFYERAAKNARNPEVKKIFAQLAEEEKEHIQSLQAKAQFLQPVLLKKSNSRKNIDHFIADQLQGKVFPDKKSWDAGNVAGISSDLEALEVGIQSEKRSIEVLSDLLAKEKKIDVRVIFSHLLAEERRHLALLQELKTACSRENA